MSAIQHFMVSSDDGLPVGGRHAFVDNLDLGALDTGFATVGSDGRVTWVNHAFVEMTKGPAIFWTGRTMPSFMVALAQLGEHDTPVGRQVAAAKAMAAEEHRWHVWRILGAERRWVFQRACERMPDGSMLLAFCDVTHQHATAETGRSVGAVVRTRRQRAGGRAVLHHDVSQAAARTHGVTA